MLFLKTDHFFIITLLLHIIHIQAFRIKLNSFPVKKGSIKDSIMPIDNPYPFNYPTLNICIGTPNNQCFNLVLSTMSHYIMIEDTRTDKEYYATIFNCSLSETYTYLGHTIGFPDQNAFFRGELAKDYARINALNNNPQSKLTIFLVQNQHNFQSTMSFDGYLGLQMIYDHSSSFKSINGSFIDYLYNTSQIYNKNFALNLNHPPEDSYIEFGEDYDDLPYCSANIKDDILDWWNCPLNKVMIYNEDMEIMSQKYSIVFNSLSNFVIVPKNIGAFITEEYILKIYGDYCYSYEDYKRIIVIKCKRNTPIDKFKDLIFVMENNIELVIQWKNLFVYNEDEEEYYSLLAIVNEGYYSDVSIGLPGFIGKKIMFDQRNKHIHIKQIALVNKDIFLKPKLTMILFITVMSGIVLIIYTKLRLIQN